MPTPVSIRFSCLTGIENGLLLYLDEQQRRCTIDLAQCAANWAQAHPAQYPQPSQCRCVGERWASSHFVLYAAERVTLINDVQIGGVQRLLDRLRIPLRLDTRQYARFREVQQMLLDAGWTTCDMT